jgi:lantibiotic modifying enzyme
MRRCIAVIACALAGLGGTPAGQTPSSSKASTTADRRFLSEAQGVARWLRSIALPQGTAIAWAGTPGPGARPIANLYSGSAGVVLFFLELHHATGDPKDLATARAGADWLLAQIESESQAGLYTGLAGLGFTLTETWKATQDTRYRDGANKVVDRLKQLAKPTGDAVEWSPVSDIISGTAGIGLWLVSASKELGRADARDLAAAAGRRLISQQIAADGGAKWAMTPASPTRLYPNFSHGTAGVAYFLAVLHQATGERRFLDAALSGARYLVKTAKTDGEVCLVFHHEPEADGLHLFYLGWCHGPAGTGRLFQQLATTTGDREWRTWLARSANGIRQSGIPERETPGFWNNLGQCCGSASVADFFLSYYQVTRDASALAFARRVTDQILAKATRDESGTRWIHAEHRVQPSNVAAQTGWMQGAAGIGAWLLRLDGVDRGRDVFVKFPDSPF